MLIVGDRSGRWGCARNVGIHRSRLGAGSTGADARGITRIRTGQCVGPSVPLDQKRHDDHNFDGEEMHDGRYDAEASGC